ncbi:unnamed protein product [Calypogeia fissa]
MVAPEGGQGRRAYAADKNSTMVASLGEEKVRAATRETRQLVVKQFLHNSPKKCATGSGRSRRFSGAGPGWSCPRPRHSGPLSIAALVQTLWRSDENPTDHLPSEGTVCHTYFPENKRVRQ